MLYPDMNLQKRTQQSTTRYRTALYLRLSREDGDKTESDSIANQRTLLEAYAADHPELCIVDEFVDDGYSGSNFERPAFQNLFRELEQGTIHFLFGTIIQPPCLSLYQFPGIDLIVQDAVHCLGGPRRLIALAEMQTQLCTALQLSRSGGRHFLCIQTICDALITHAVDFPAKNVLHRFRCQFIYNLLSVLRQQTEQRQLHEP